MQEREQERKNLRIFSILFLILAAADVVNLIATFALGDWSVSAITQRAETTAGLARTSIIVVVTVVALEVLVLLYLGLMGLRQCNGKPVASTHITIAKVALVFLVLALILVAISFFSDPQKDWVALCTATASVLFGFCYIRSAKIVGT